MRARWAPALAFLLVAVPAFGAAQTATPYIVGGTVAPSGAYPGVAALYLEKDGGSFFCGGTLVDRLWVLTAAHCAEGMVAADSAAVIGNGNRFLGSLHAIAQVHMHPDYDGDTLRNDVALLKLASPASVAPIHVLPASLTTLAAGGRTGTVVGWGYTESSEAVQSSLRRVDVPIVTNAQCQSSYTAARFNVQITADMLCAGNPPTTGTCSGDSGGPLFVASQGFNFQAGIVSWGAAGCQHAGAYSVFARTSQFEAWLAQTVGHPLGVPGVLDLTLRSPWVATYTAQLRSADGTTLLATCAGDRVAGTFGCEAEEGAVVTVTNLEDGRVQLTSGTYRLVLMAQDADGGNVSVPLVKTIVVRPALTTPIFLALRPAAALARMDLGRSPVPAAEATFRNASGAELGSCLLDREAMSLACAGGASELAYPYLALPAGTATASYRGIAADGENVTKPLTTRAMAVAGRITSLRPNLVVNGSVLQFSFLSLAQFDFTATVTPYGSSDPVGTCTVDPVARSLACDGDVHALRYPLAAVPTQRTNVTLEADGHTTPTLLPYALRTGRTTVVPARFA